MKKIAHVVWDYAPQLSGPIAKRIVSRDPSAVIFLRDIGACADRQDAMSRNKKWIDELPQGRYQGYLQRPLFHGLIKSCRYASVFWNIFGFGFSVRSVWRMLTGPKYWVLHGMMIPLGLIVLMRLVGKRVVLIHWGGHMISFAGKRARVFYVASLRLLNHMFVLMEPEAVYYRKWLPNDKVSTLPYYVDTKMWQDEFAEYDHDGKPIRKVILGPNAWSLELYDKILDRMPVGSWDKIICLLSTVRENEKEKIDQFVAKYAGKFGSSFYAWREVVPYAKYLEFVNQTPYYLSPITTQSGLGAISISIRMGKTIFLSGDNYDWIRSLGVKVFPSSSLKDYSYEELSCSRLSFEERIANKNVFRDYFTHTINKKVWFESLLKSLVVLKNGNDDE